MSPHEKQERRTHSSSSINKKNQESTNNNGDRSANLLDSTKGTTTIHDGEFNATAGNRISVTINTGPEPAIQHIPSKNRRNKFSPKNRSKSSDTVALITPQKSKGNEAQTTTTWVHTLPIVERSCDIYYRHLAPKGRGSPLWIPEPNKQLPIEYQRTGMRLGDVGILASDGSFDFLFNACLPCSDLINPQKMPEDFQPFILDPLDIQRQSEFKSASHLSSASIQRSCSNDDLQGLEFESTASEGAILTMPFGSNSTDVRTIILLRKYVALHAENWYRYVVNIRGREAENGDVRLVTGFDKTTSWGMATFANSTAQRDSFQLRFRPIQDGAVGKMYRWESLSGMAEALRVGPDASEVETLRMNDPEEEGKEYENQSLFVRTLNVTLQGNVWRKLQQELGEVAVDDDQESQAPSSPSASNSGPTSPTPPTPESGRGSGMLTFKTRGGSSTRKLSGALTFHPSKLLNDILLDACPYARMAITEDREWMSVMTKLDSVLPSDEELRLRISRKFDTYETEGVALLKEKVNSYITDLPKSPTRSKTHFQSGFENQNKNLGNPSDIQALQSKFDELIFKPRGRINPSENALYMKDGGMIRRVRKFSPNRED